MIRVIPAGARHFSDFDWLQTYWLFSFSDYYDPDNIQLGALRVFNDDVVAPGTGFPTHPHHEMEIVTVVLDGEMTHRDSMGNVAVIKPGDVQRMSAGTGLTHSEFNLARKPVHFYQIWIFPDERGLKPTYDQRSIPAETWKNRIAPVASGEGKPGVVTFHTAATIYRGDLEAGHKTEFACHDDRRIFVYLTQGELSINGTALRKNDQARIDLADGLEIRAGAASEFVLIDVPSCKGWGYSRETLRGSKG